MTKTAENYAITVTFKELRSNIARTQFYETAPWLTKTLRQSTYFELFPEWRITNGSIHYHGIIQIHDKIKWYKSTLPQLKRMGYILVKKIDDLCKWNDYINKDICTAQGILGEDMFFPICTYKDVLKHHLMIKNQIPVIEEATTLLRPSIWDLVL